MIPHGSLSEDKNNVFAAYFRINSKVNPGITRLRLTALEPDALYELEGEDKAYGGDELMNIGIIIDMWGDFQSRTFRLKRVNK